MHSKKKLLLMAFTCCMSYQGAHAINMTLDPETFNSIGFRIKPELPTISKRGLFTSLGFLSSITGIRAIYKGFTHTPTHEGQPEHTRWARRNQQLIECSGGLALLTAGILTIHKFGA